MEPDDIVFQAATWLGSGLIIGNGDPEGVGGFWRRAASLVGHDASSIAPSSLLAPNQNPLRHGRCRLWVRTLIPLILAIVLHEISHGWAANAFGDPTARKLGRLSLNPVRHVDPVGTLVLPMILAVSGAPVFGWAKPVPVVARRMRNPRLHMILVALAGPGMNLLLAIVAAIGVAVMRWFGPGDGTGWIFLYLNLANFLVINLFLAIFNMLPIPPFDGGHVVEGLLPRRLAKRYAKLHRIALPMLIFLLLVVPMIAPEANIVERIVGPPVRLLIGLLAG